MIEFNIGVLGFKKQMKKRVIAGPPNISSSPDIEFKDSAFAAEVALDFTVFTVFKDVSKAQVLICV